MQNTKAQEKIKDERKTWKIEQWCANSGNLKLRSEIHAGKLMN